MFGTAATRPPRRTLLPLSAVGLLKSRMALPGVEAALSVKVAPTSVLLAVAPLTVSSVGS